MGRRSPSCGLRPALAPCPRTIRTAGFTHSGATRKAATVSVFRLRVLGRLRAGGGRRELRRLHDHNAAATRSWRCWPCAATSAAPGSGWSRSSGPKKPTEARAQQGLRDALLRDPSRPLPERCAIRQPPPACSHPLSSFPTSSRSLKRRVRAATRTPCRRTPARCSMASTWTAHRSSNAGWTANAPALARQYAEALEHLATAAERAGSWHEAVRWWGRAVEHDPVNSHFVLQHARALAAIGDRANALRAAEAHARRLRGELDLEPDGDFLAAIERIRRGETPVRRGLLPRLTPGPADAQVPQPRLLPREPSAGSTGAPAPAPTEPISEGRRERHWVPWAAVAVVVMLAASFGVGRWLMIHAARPRPSANRGRRAAVLVPRGRFIARVSRRRAPRRVADQALRCGIAQSDRPNIGP